ncbi:restriction endonuclease subunit S [Magnetospirillum fulvum]|uniref:Restriction modification system DNA specificity domain-containing protein n=1 Tax=Magnetospirillum fulvum MGU-K5 TaxID=1316936 RepID=S9TV12_MAGFU|nr:restriction endonuclease subunit S [Magnetospirillum fulvum]EPY02315.1 restriction modification system DNA specificity domain-containing protein [Magnetospirillum fulvum MGU-K5]
MSFPRYPEYKDSGVEWLGEVPSEWKVRRLKQVATVFPSNIDKKAYDDEAPVRLCNYVDVYYNEEITGRLAFMEATATPEQVSRFTLRADDTIITKDSETADDIAIAAHVPQDLPGIVCGYHLSMVRPNQGGQGRFIKRLFDSRWLKAQFEVAARGLTRVGLSQYAIDNVIVTVPPIDEQAAIVAFLDRETGKIDALVAEQERLIELLKEKRQAVISHAVTKGLDPTVPMKDSGIEWLGAVPAHWQVKRIKYVVKSIEQGWSPQCEGYPADDDDTWGVLKVGCVNGGAFSYLENKVLPESLEPAPSLAIKSGDLLVSRANTLELVGSAAVVEQDHPRLMLCDKLYRLRLDHNMALPTFLANFLGTRCARGQIELGASGASSSMQNIGQGTILEMPVALPPVDEQREIISAIGRNTAKLDSLTTESQHAIDLLKERRAALISAAVTGKIDVRGLGVSVSDDQKVPA